MKPLIIVLSVLFLTGCNRYFRPVNVNAPTKDMVAGFIGSNKIFIVHDYSYNYELQNPKLNKEGTALTGDLKKIRGFRVTQGSRNKVYYHYRPAKPDHIITNQVHLYTSQQLITTPGVATNIPLDIISRTEALQFDKNKTTRKNVGIALAILVGVGVAVATAAAMSSLAFGISPI